MNVSHTLGVSAGGMGATSAGGGTLITPSSGSALFSWPVLAVSLEASWKLFAMCLFVVVLVKNRLLPDATAPVLSQVAFRIMIPAYMMTKVVVTLQREPSWALMGLPILAVFQILLGALLGKLGWFLVGGSGVKRTLTPQWQEVTLPPGDAPPKETYQLCSSSSNKSVESLSCISYKSSDSEGEPEGEAETETDPLKYQTPEGCQSRTGHACLAPEAQKPGEGKSRLGSTLLPPQAAAEGSNGDGIDQGQREAMVMISSAFGNSGILPLVLISGLLGPEAADQAGGYLALYLIGWAPGLWTIGYQIITRGVHQEPMAGEGSRSGEGGAMRVWWSKGARLLGQIFNPPLYGILLGLLIGATPLSRSVMPEAGARGGAGGGVEGSGNGALFDAVLSGLLKPCFDAAGTLGSGFLSVQAVVMAASFASSIPPLSLQPLLRWVAAAKQALGQRRGASPPQTDLEPLKPDVECAHEHIPQGLHGSSQGVPLVYLDSGAKSGGSAFLGAHLAGGSETEDAPGDSHEATAHAGTPNHMPTGSSMGRFPAPPGLENRHVHGRDRLEASARFPEGRALLVICVVRLVLLPAIAAAAIKPLSRAGYLPTSPLCLLLLMVQMCMPSAQNLVLVAQLHEETRNLATLLSSLLLKLYIISIIPITIWTSIFLHLVQQ